MGDYVDVYSSFLERFVSMDGKILDDSAAVMFLSSMGGKLEETIAAIRQRDSIVTWEDVITRLRCRRTSASPKSGVKIGRAYTANDTMRTQVSDCP